MFLNRNAMTCLKPGRIGCLSPHVVVLFVFNDSRRTVIALFVVFARVASTYSVSFYKKKPVFSTTMVACFPKLEIFPD